MAKTLELKQKLIGGMTDNLLNYPPDNRDVSTVEFYMLCVLLGIYDKTDESRLLDAISTLWCKIGDITYLGLLTRQPNQPFGSDTHHKEKQMHDGYSVIACCDKLAALKIDEYGKRHGFIFKYHYDPSNMKPKFKDLFTKEYWRLTLHPHVVAIARIKARRYPGIINLMFLYGAVIIESCRKPSETSGKLLMWIASNSIKRWYLKPLWWLFNNRMRKQYGKNYVSELFRIYYGGSELNDLYKLSRCL